ncbi:MAG: hypothetical protein WAL90_11985 [Desulfobacterales bacterium]
MTAPAKGFIFGPEPPNHFTLIGLFLAAGMAVGFFLVCLVPAFGNLVLLTGLVLYFRLTAVTVLQRMIYGGREFAWLPK